LTWKRRRPRLLAQLRGADGGEALNKKALSERDICTKFITPAVQQAGWDIQSQIREEVYFNKGKVLVRGRQHNVASRNAPTTSSILSPTSRWP